ncbi:MAG: tRNA (N(6)-L-threonylcarbamoyladenosine(37)-C(2))-methylthiotransferase [Candidatus Diapherotrites archaeon]|nr:tRNA (N(6)-L-threonylcarbamoyladenosine(37)-C(2))-methylthiotransferase [Candidatus Diapherotrites archaeon]
MVHSCGVKTATEFKMKRRVLTLKKLNSSAQIMVSGCLPKINPHLLAEEQRVVQTGPALEQIAKIAGITPAVFSPTIEQERFNPFVSIIPISTGCLSSCSFCGTKKAKGVLKSYPIQAIQERFEHDLKNNTKEFWLASQDNGCYGVDLKTNIAKLLEALLSNSGDFRIRIGMMSPQYLINYYDELVSLFNDERLYKFLHLPVQSGNNRILKLMRRQYTVEDFSELVKSLRKDINGVTISTDIIAGFPTETKKEFNDTLRLVEEHKFEIINISKYGERPGTDAEKMLQLHDREKFARTQELTRLHRNISLEQNKTLVGRKDKVLVNEVAKINGFVGRTNSYRPVVVPKAELNSFAIARIKEAYPHFLKGKIEEWA